MCYSVDEPHLELIEELPGSVWVCNEHSNLHHIGFWTDDLTGDTAALIGSRVPHAALRASRRIAPLSFAYHRIDLGVRIEIVDTTMRPAMEFLFRPEAS